MQRNVAECQAGNEPPDGLSNAAAAASVKTSIVSRAQKTDEAIRHMAHDEAALPFPHRSKWVGPVVKRAQILISPGRRSELHIKLQMFKHQ
jgi:hypothetical protein